MSTIGSRIRVRREQLNLSQVDLANRLGYKSRSSINKIELDLRNLTQSRIKAIADALETTPSYIMGWDEADASDAPNRSDPANVIPFTKPASFVPIVGAIPAGLPVIAEEDIEGYAPVDYSDPENYFWLRVQGDSMVNAGIKTDDLVLIRRQPCAEPGQIVACRVNGDEATLKRFTRQGDTVLLMPENPSYSPYIVSTSEFETGYASILGVAIEIKRKI